jgi:hypothetical protein
VKKRNRLYALLFISLLSHSAYAQTKPHTKGNFLQRLFGEGTEPQKADVDKKKQAAQNGPQFAGCSKAVDRSSNITVKRFVDARYLDEVFKGKLKGQGKNIILTANKHGLDPVFFAAIMAHETGWGLSSKIKNQNNPGGIFRNGKYASFRTIEEGIESMAANLRNRYINKGILTIRGVAAVYAPVGAKNDPKKRNHLWPGGVTAIMNKLIKGSTNMGNTKTVAKK